MSVYRLGAVDGVNYTLRHRTKEYRRNYFDREMKGYSLYNDYTALVYDKYMQVALTIYCLILAPYYVNKYRKLLCGYRPSSFFNVNIKMKGKYILLRFFSDVLCIYKKRSYTCIF